MAYGGVYLCGNRHGQCSLIANVSPAQTIKKSLNRRQAQMCEKASESELNEWASFQLESIHVSIDFQYGTESGKSCVCKCAAMINHKISSAYSAVVNMKLYAHAHTHNVWLIFDKGQTFYFI